MSDESPRLTETPDAASEPAALLRRSAGPVPPELPGLLRVRAARRVVGPSLLLLAIAAGAYVAYRLIDSPAPDVTATALARAEARPEAPASAVPTAAPAPLEPLGRSASPAPGSLDRAAPREPSRTAEAEPVVRFRADEREAELQGGEGQLRIQSIPWARVFLDGRDTRRTTPVPAMTVAAGRHEIGLRTPDGVMHTFKVTVRAGETVRLARQL